MLSTGKRVPEAHYEDLHNNRTRTKVDSFHYSGKENTFSWKLLLKGDLLARNVNLMAAVLYPFKIVGGSTRTFFTLCDLLHNFMGT